MKREDHRIAKLIQETISNLQLRLNKVNILTEAASGYYHVTPIIAAMAGGNVTAICKDSVHGKAKDVMAYVGEQAKIHGVGDRITLVDELYDNVIEQSDLITNLGFVRPIDASFIDKMKPNAVITLMCEPWEVRAQDFDKESAVKKGILHAGTNEDADHLQVFDNTCSLILKIMLNLNLEVYQSHVLVISSDKFGDRIFKALQKNGTHVMLNPSDKNVNLEDLPFSRLDAIIVADYCREEDIIGKENSVINIVHLAHRHPEVKIIQFAGKIDTAELKKHKLEYYPEYEVGAYKMGQTFSYLGPKPVIDLHAAGLKVGEGLLKIRHSNTISEEEQGVLIRNYFTEF